MHAADDGWASSRSEFAETQNNKEAFISRGHALCIIEVDDGVCERESKRNQQRELIKECTLQLQGSSHYSSLHFIYSVVYSGKGHT